MNDFGQRIIEAAESAMVKFFGTGDWFKVDYGTKFQIPPADLRAIYGSVDMDRVKARVRERIEERIADSIINNMATEIGTDVKQIMCNTELREDLRAQLRAAIRSAKDGVSATDHHPRHRAGN